MTPAKPECKDSQQAMCMEWFRELKTQLADIQEGISEIRTIYGVQQNQLKTQDQEIERMKKTLFGNGGTGLCTKVSAILYICSCIGAYIVIVAGQAAVEWVKTALMR